MHALLSRTDLLVESEWTVLAAVVDQPHAVLARAGAGQARGDELEDRDLLGDGRVVDRNDRAEAVRPGPGGTRRAPLPAMSDRP